MDPIALNVTLNGSILAESSKSILENPLITALIGAFAGAIAAGSIQFIIEEKRFRRQEKAIKIQAHSNLFGCRYRLLQYFHSFFLLNIAARSSQIYAKIIAAGLINFAPAKNLLDKGKVEGAKKYVNKQFISKYEGSPDLSESLMSKEASKKLQLQLGDVEERFWTFIGQIRTSFNDTIIDEFVKEIETAEELIAKFDEEIAIIFAEIEKDVEDDLNSICFDKSNGSKYADYPNKNRDNFVAEKKKKLEEKRDSTIKDAKKKIGILDTKIEDLLKHLENILNDPQYSRDCKLFCSDKRCPLKPPSDKEKIVHDTIA